MSAISDALTRSKANQSIAYNKGLQLKASLPNIDFTSGGSIGQLNEFSNRSADKRRYSLFRGWVYSAINAIALEGSSQSPNVGRLVNSIGENSQRSSPLSAKQWEINKASSYVRGKSAKQELEIISDHPLLAALEKPNSFQHSSEFVYSFIANLTLTGFGYILGGETDNGFEFFCLPTTWVTPLHKKGPFAEFIIRNPNNPSSQKGVVLTKEQVTFAYLPNPSDPLSALSPSQAQSNAILIDDHIQSSQQKFFGNGIFPSVIITIGNNPHPDVVGGAMRPRLTGAQRRQVEGAVGKVSRGIANYGNPAIIDGMVEKIEKLSMTQTEMGWEKSEKTVRTRILSAFGVHPFILGEEIVGSYAQAYVVRDVFCQRVNFYLNLLSMVMSKFADEVVEGDDKLLVWWDECKAKDPQLEERTWAGARSRDDVSQNEFRAWMGLPPDDDRNESNINRNALPAVTSIATQATSGGISVEQAEAILVNMGLPSADAKTIAGEGPSEETLEENEELEVADEENEIEEVSSTLATIAKSQAKQIDIVKSRINQLKNKSKTPNINIEVKPADVNMPDINVAAPEVTVEAPIVNVAAPSVEINPKIDVEVNRTGAPTKAEITHPDGRLSKVELKE